MVRAADGTTAPVSVWKSVPYFHLGPPGAEARSSRTGSQAEGNGESSESSRKRTSRKKPPTTGIWPCKINGCNKQFAREADLKRHQRTTKMHSMPNFACPQCDASFTRTDALRRHQKSRHNGVVIEPLEQPNGDENEDGRSRSGTPSSKGKEKEANIPVQTHQGAPTHTGPSSYYRSHTATITPHIPHPSMPQLPDMNHPAASSSTGPTWSSYPSNWQNGSLPPNMGPIGYLSQPMYYPSPHYRPHTNGYHSDAPTSYQVQRLKAPETGSSSQASTSRNSSSQPPHQSMQTPTMSNGSDPIIDPNLDSGSELTEAQVLAAVQAVLMQAEAKDQREREEKEREQQQQQHNLGGNDMAARDSESMDRDDHDDLNDRNGLESLDLDDGMDGLHGYGSSLNRPEPMEHMLTEDGEPMLNPAELLTQESLASPPPS